MAKNRKLPKWVRERQHSKAMALVRYGVRLNQESYRALIKQIQRGESEYLGLISNARTLHLVTVDDPRQGAVEMKVIYDKIRKELITVLAMDMEVYVR